MTSPLSTDLEAVQGEEDLPFFNTSAPEPLILLRDFRPEGNPEAPETGSDHSALVPTSFIENDSPPPCPA